MQVREGYGTTETVTACCLTPPHMFKEGSIGVPFPDTYIKIVEPDTDKEVPYGTEGEILLAGPTVMKEYMKHPDETAQTLRRHADGLTWVYTGDLGTMDSEGFVYFRGRAKRMIVSSGYNVYPGQIENILDANEMVQMSLRQARRRHPRERRDPSGADELLLQAHREIRHALRHRVPRRAAQDARRQGRLPRFGGRGAGQARRRGARRARRGGEKVSKKRAAL